VGYIGVFFGRLIQAAVSRQREYLADAAAVQFTRNPAGIGGALLKIEESAMQGGTGSRVHNAHAEEAGHFFFASNLGRLASRAFATHPPLLERIRRIDPALLRELGPGSPPASA
jgi:Zn-dependent protease with chaperone function